LITKIWALAMLIATRLLLILSPFRGQSNTYTFKGFIIYCQTSLHFFLRSHYPTNVWEGKCSYIQKQLLWFKVYQIDKLKKNISMQFYYCTNYVFFICVLSIFLLS
jgi:hypothetical protein